MSFYGVWSLFENLPAFVDPDFYRFSQLIPQDILLSVLKVNSDFVETTCCLIQVRQICADFGILIGITAIFPPSIYLRIK
jgi:hypothetical protein